nr:MAG TPA: hypothetical protein [Caudoviricetes sp.]
MAKPHAFILYKKRCKLLMNSFKNLQIFICQSDTRQTRSRDSQGNSLNFLSLLRKEEWIKLNK